MKNILVSLDFDNSEDILLKKALEFGKAFKAKIWILHIAAPEPEFIGYEPGPQYIRDARAEDLRIEHKNLQKFSKYLENKGLQAEALLIQGATIETIMEEAKKLKADMIIAGQEKKSFLYKAFTGSVSSEIIKKSKIPVLIVPIA
jgi:nucleotide-binding universal stress UspA family protein